MLIVQECFPFIDFPSRAAASPRIARIEEPGDALGLSWIKALPGKKRLCFFRGQLFVIQVYMGFKLARAHILHAQRAMDAPVVKAAGEALSASPQLIVLEIPPANTQIAANA